MTVFIGLSLTYEYLTSVLSSSALEFSLGATKELFLNRGSIQSIIPNPEDRIPHNADSKRLEMVIKTSRFLICSATMYGGGQKTISNLSQAVGLPQKAAAKEEEAIERRHKTRRNAVIIINVQHQSWFLCAVFGWRIFWRFLHTPKTRYCGAISGGTRLPTRFPFPTDINLTTLAIVLQGTVLLW